MTPAVQSLEHSQPIIVSVMVHVPDVSAGLAWYAKAFDGAQRCVVPEMQDFEFLDIGGVRLELVPADDKVASGAAGSVVYWWVSSVESALQHLQSCGATLYRGPMMIEGGHRMCQVRDPWGNCIGLRGPG